MASIIARSSAPPDGGPAATDTSAAAAGVGGTGARAASGDCIAGTVASGARSPGITASKERCSSVRRSGISFSWYSTFETSVGWICFGSTPIAPSARACPTYSSPSCEVYIMIGMVAVRGLFLMICTAWKPSMPGIR